MKKIEENRAALFTLTLTMAGSRGTNSCFTLTWIVNNVGLRYKLTGNGSELYQEMKLGECNGHCEMESGLQ